MVKAALVLALVPGCFWHSYGRLMATHVDVLLGTARKGVDLLEAGRMTAETMPELTYPLERAQAFATRAWATGGSPAPPSLVAFERLLARYRELVDGLDELRRTTTGTKAREALAHRLAVAEAAGEEVLAALHAEHRL